jgi:hypothetical protein
MIALTFAPSSYYIFIDLNDLYTVEAQIFVGLKFHSFDTHLCKPSVRFSLTPISPLADFNATEMPSIRMSIEPTGVLISQRKKPCPQGVLNQGPLRPLGYHVSSLITEVF